jgi:hypothetical protein
MGLYSIMGCGIASCLGALKGLLYKGDRICIPSLRMYVNPEVSTCAYT